MFVFTNFIMVSCLSWNHVPIHPFEVVNFFSELHLLLMASDLPDHVFVTPTNDIKLVPSNSSFRSKLKTYLFTSTHQQLTTPLIRRTYSIWARFKCLTLRYKLWTDYCWVMSILLNFYWWRMLLACNILRFKVLIFLATLTLTTQWPELALHCWQLVGKITHMEWQPYIILIASHKCTKGLWPPASAGTNLSTSKRWKA